MTMAIEAHGVIKRYGKGAATHEALRGVDLSVREGELLMLAGPSGSGKTTLLSILGCILRPTEGDVELLGERVSDLDESDLPAMRLDRVGFVFQGGNLIESLTALDNVALMLRLRGRSKKGSRREAAVLLERLGIADRALHLPKEMSGGQRQRVAIARALVNEPALLLADEPTGNLDSVTSGDIMGQLAALNGHGQTIVLVTHEHDIADYAKRQVHLKDGVIERDFLNERVESAV
jgi:putative ABC transport system ATP-binding protein